MFSDLLDLFTYFPQKEKTFDNLSSQQVQPIISPLQNRRQSFGQSMHSTTKSLDLMEEIWTRLQERFTGMSAAFRFFDRNCSG